MILVIGEILIDEYHLEDKILKKPGGAPFNVAANIKHFGGDVAFYGAVGEDSDGAFLHTLAQQKFKDNAFVEVLPLRHTTKAQVTLKNGERDFTFIRDKGADYALNFKTFLEIYEKVQPDLIHVGSLLLTKKEGVTFINQLLQFVTLNNIPLSFDLNYRSDIFGSISNHRTHLTNIFKKAKIVKFSDNEFLMYNNRETIEACLSTFKHQRDNLLVITRGADGANYYYNNLAKHVPSIKVKSVDTTGAGDAFYAYLLFSLDKNFKTINESLLDKSIKGANIVGALATLKHGAIDILPPKDKLVEIISNHEEN